MKSNRREFFETIGAGAAGLTLGAGILSSISCKSPDPKKEADDGQVLFVGDNIAVAETQYGKIRGYQLRGVYYFLGIPYGADTSGANRFMPPQKPKPWTEVYPALWWGNTAPHEHGKQVMPPHTPLPGSLKIRTVSDDCLEQRVYSAINTETSAPVMPGSTAVGYSNASGIEARWLQHE